MNDRVPGADAVPPAPTPRATLQDCDREPIHIPGQIQPHGVLFAFDEQARLVAWSANAATLPLAAPRLGLPLAELALPEAVAEAVQACMAEAQDGASPPQALESRFAGQAYDTVVHGHEGRFLLEFERRESDADAIAAFALQAHRAMDRLRRQRGRDALLQLAAQEVRSLTGFDRVMAYVFRHDDSGDVVAEARREDLEPWAGRRYPASDIPAQARRLYTLNTLRLIADAHYEPVPVLARAGDAPLDLSLSVLRSVSPIHLEYLRNMGVAASMSVSIVVQGRLWGMLACHHHAPRLVPHSIRMACDVLAQLLAVSVQGLETRERAELVRQGAVLQAAVAEAIAQDVEPLRALQEQAPAICEWLDAEGLALVQGGRLLLHGPVPEALARATGAALAAGAAMAGQAGGEAMPGQAGRAAMPGHGGDLLVWKAQAEWPAELQPLLGPWVGLLALRVDPAAACWLLAWRREQVETVRWGGRPEKPVQPGPLGPRLTPRGSFEEWRETVRGTAVPWDSARLEGAQALLATLHRASHVRHAEVERARTQMMTILGHDLRDPLHSISMAARALQQEPGREGGTASAGGLGRRIRDSSGRMQRLVGQMLDLGRIRSGIGLGLRPVPADVVALVADLVDEARTAHPGSVYELKLPPRLLASFDPDRLAQAVGNLLGNARHHGELGRPIGVRLVHEGEQLLLEVRNAAPPIPESAQAQLFSAFKRRDPARGGGHAGLGLGLYVAHEIVSGHGGRLEYHYEAPEVVFRVSLPLGAGVPEAQGVESPAPAAPAGRAVETGRDGSAAGPRRVLVIDDYADSADTLCELLSLEGYEAHAARDAPALLRLAAEPCAAILLDVQMPGLSGVELARQLRATLPAPLPRLIAVTGKTQAELGADAAVFDAVLDKPIDLDRLLALLAAAPAR